MIKIIFWGKLSVPHCDLIVLSSQAKVIYENFLKPKLKCFIVLKCMHVKDYKKAKAQGFATLPSLPCLILWEGWIYVDPLMQFKSLPVKKIDILRTIFKNHAFLRTSSGYLLKRRDHWQLFVRLSDRH